MLFQLKKEELKDFVLHLLRDHPIVHRYLLFFRRYFYYQRRHHISVFHEKLVTLKPTLSAKFDKHYTPEHNDKLKTIHKKQNKTKNIISPVKLAW